MSFKEQIDQTKLPRHIAVIMDGNGRWAKQRGKLRIFGHENGVISVRETAEAAAELGIEYLTLYAFSTENWKRPRREVEALMGLLLRTISIEIKTLNDNNIRLQAIGDLNALNDSIRKRVLQAIDETRNNNRMTLVLALSYSSHYEITEAVKAIATKYKNDQVALDDINEALISDHLFTKDIPDPQAAHPHQRRVSHQQLPALAACLLRVVHHAQALARFP